ncbi:hypothetical protein [Pseudomonas serbica]|uniref:hypothetical protein n=1 Tax=Pseudomonas serbica TaxID=2965074 RepID=UPI00237B659A|nr:hypothetical protein [Pseudomonas serbica]
MHSTDDARGSKTGKTSSGSNGKPFNAASLRKRVEQRRTLKVGTIGVMPFSISSLLPQTTPSQDGRKRLEQYLDAVIKGNETFIKHQLRQAELQVRGVRFVPDQVVNAIYRSAMREVKLNGRFVMANGELLKETLPQPSYTVPTLKPLDLGLVRDPKRDQEIYRSMMQFSLDDTGIVATAQGEDNV